MIADQRQPQHSVTRRSDCVSNLALLGGQRRELRQLSRPTPAEIARAVANIRAWRSYLPAACVTVMINDGWQWST
jgi:hypothetical protein